MRLCLPLTLSGVDEKPHKKAPIRNDLSGLFVLLLVDRSQCSYWVLSSLRLLCTVSSLRLITACFLVLLLLISCCLNVVFICLMFVTGLFAFFSFQACIVLLLRPSTFFENNVRPYFKLTLWSIRVVISPLKGLSPSNINMQKLLVNNTNQLQQERCFFRLHHRLLPTY